MCKFPYFNYTPQGCAGQKRKRKKGARQTKSQVFAKNLQPPKLVNIYFQLGNLLLIHIVAFPAEIMSQAKWTKCSQWANMSSGESAHLLFAGLFLQQFRNICTFPFYLEASQCLCFQCLSFQAELLDATVERCLSMKRRAKNTNPNDLLGLKSKVSPLSLLTLYLIWRP